MECCPSTENVRAQSHYCFTSQLDCAHEWTSKLAARAQVDYASQLTQLPTSQAFHSFRCIYRSEPFISFSSSLFYLSVCSSWEKRLLTATATILPCTCSYFTAYRIFISTWVWAQLFLISSVFFSIFLYLNAVGIANDIRYGQFARRHLPWDYCTVVR